MTQVGIDDLVWPRIKDGGNFGGGIGRYFTCNIRGDITVDHRFKSDVTGFNAQPLRAELRRDEVGLREHRRDGQLLLRLQHALALHALHRLRPWRGAQRSSGGRGTGRWCARSRCAVPAVYGSAAAIDGRSAGHSWMRPAPLMTGFVFNLHDRLKLDTGYRFLYLGSGKTGQTADIVSAATAARSTSTTCTPTRSASACATTSAEAEA